MKKRNIAGTIADATLPKTPVTIGGKEYNLCFDLGALAEAETAINRELVKAGAAAEVNLLSQLPQLNLANTRIVFAAAVRVFHPELSYDEAKRLPQLPDLYNVATAIASAWESASITPDPQNPTPAE